MAPCELPQAPLQNGELSAAYVVAYKCAEQGNRDKLAIVVGVLAVAAFGVHYKLIVGERT